MTSLDEGDIVKQGDIVSYNENYFNIDPLNKKQVALSMGTLLNTALMESPETLEDASVISEKAAGKLVTRMAVERDITVEFAQGIHDMVAIGDQVEVDSPLCLIEDPLTIDSDLFSEDTFDTLKVLSSNAPKAKYAGTISKIECFYHGDEEDLSESLKDIIHESNLRRRRLSRDKGEQAITGQVDDEMHIDGKPLLLDHAVIKVIIEMDVPVGIGDKVVFSNQMKSIFSRVMSGTNETETGEALDAIFSYSSFSNRLSNSPDVIGTTTTLLSLISKQAAKIYKEG